MHIGIIGSGQLAQMMAQAGKKLDMTFSFVCDSLAEADPVTGLGEVVINEGFDSVKALYDAMGKPDVITIEKESVDPILLDGLKKFCPVAPNSKAVTITQNRSSEKNFLNGINIPTVGFASVSTAEAIETTVKTFGFPVVIKSEELGYDGKNQWRLFNDSDLKEFVKNFSPSQVVVEQWVAFSAEVSMIASRNTKGEKVFYPLTENRHENGILLTSIVPTRWAEKFEAKAVSYINQIMETLDYVGTIAMECFIVGDELLVNELAPRVHNSGHWTMTGSVTSQFENHLRAIAGMPLGETRITQQTAMLNLLGKAVTEEQIQTPDATLFWYNKELRPGRKMGHINIRHENAQVLEESLKALEKQIYSTH
jgi:5-(carboxyamino)imidazole ribonucleotide synthase